jgi:hypothetical protein
VCRWKDDEYKVDATGTLNLEFFEVIDPEKGLFMMVSEYRRLYTGVSLEDWL